MYDDAEETVMKGLGQVSRQRGRPREDHRDADSAQDACATEEKARLRGKWHRHSCLCAVNEAWDSEPANPVASLARF